jgi:Ni,Fe-hydrogenase III small subunit
MGGLDEWADRLPMDKFDVRPSIQVTRSGQYADAVARDRTGQLTAEVRDAINRLLAALDEPQLHGITSSTA